MHKRLLFVGGLLSIFLLTGCGGKTTSMPLQFDGYAMQRYTNNKIYLQSHTPISTDMHVIYQATQQGTGTANSLIVAKISISSGASIEEIVELNIQQLQQKLSNYQGTDPKPAKTTCNDIRLT
jgi:hypothetical protein